MKNRLLVSKSRQVSQQKTHELSKGPIRQTSGLYSPVGRYQAFHHPTHQCLLTQYSESKQSKN